MVGDLRESERKLQEKGKKIAVTREKLACLARNWKKRMKGDEKEELQ